MLLVIALVLAFLLRTFVVQVFYIPSSSMEPTLSVNDRMIVEKLTYRFREPARGEIVVFEGESLTDTAVDDTAGDRIVRVVGQFLGVVPASARDFVKRVDNLALAHEVTYAFPQVLDRWDFLPEIDQDFHHTVAIPIINTKPVDIFNSFIRRIQELSDQYHRVTTDVVGVA